VPGLPGHCPRAATRLKQPLTVVFPASALVVANGGVEYAGSSSCAWPDHPLHLHERAANSFLRAQAV
jgi:hypothetical protein